MTLRLPQTKFKPGPRSGTWVLLLVFACLTLTNPVRADSVINLLIENDVVSGDDRHYTSGVMLNYVSGVNEGPKRLRNMGIHIPGLDPDDKMHVAVSLGHEIYTPTVITEAALIEDDRPYAGYIYLAAGFTTENPDEIETWRLSLGLVGPGAKAEYIQNTLHEKIGSDLAEGWDNQLGNEWVAQFAYEKKWLKLARTRTLFNTTEVDFIPHFSAAVGNLSSYAGVGGMARIGRGLDHDYGPPRVRPSLPVSQFYKQDPGASWYFFVGLDARLVLNNIFIDGNYFRNSHSVDRENFVGDLQAGFVWNNRRFRVAYNWILRSREFKQQRERDLFASLSISAHF
ncbi:MAG: lipid A deacylase LpxR family protein [Pseudomonadota bacterium]